VVGDLEQQEIVQGKLADLARQRRGFAEQLEAAEERAARHNAVTGLKNMQALCAQAAAGLDRLNDTGRRNVLLDLVEEISVKQDRTLEIHGFLSGGGFSRPSSTRAQFRGSPDAVSDPPSSTSGKLPGVGYLLTVSAARQK
jgi:hypothetical protein